MEAQPEKKTMLELAQSRGITFKCIKCGRIIEDIKDYPCSCNK